MRGWILDAYADYAKDAMVLWLWTPRGPRRIEDPAYRPRFYVHGSRTDLEALKRQLGGLDGVDEAAWMERKIDIRSTVPVTVLEVLPRRYGDLRPLADWVDREGRYVDYRLYDVDLRHGQRYFLEHDLLPLSETTYNGRWHRQEEPFALEYELPPLKALELDVDVEAPLGLPRFEDRLRRARLGDRVLEGREAEVLEGLHRALREGDPDILLTANGDPFVVPYLMRKAEALGVDLVLGRERQPFRPREGKSYFTYGKIIYKPGQHLLRGRLHLDVNHFAHRESGFHGLAEMSRLARLPPQEMLRLTPGTAITAMQVNEAHRQGYVVLWKKNQPEDFKTAEELVLCDRGGFILEPQVGLHEGIVELDYASLYPNIMRAFNISPETIFCPCCHDKGQAAPVIGHHTCTHRVGLIPTVLEPLLERKAYYKRKKREEGPKQAVYEARDNILKWMLVTCYDGRTLVPYQEGGVAKIEPISEVIDRHLPNGPGIVPAPPGLSVFGLDDDVNPIREPVRKLIKVPAPEEMFRITLVGGRELIVTPNHEFFVRAENGWERRRADALQVGDEIPVASEWKPGITHIKSLNAAQVLLGKTSTREQELWRVRGPFLKKKIATRFRLVYRAATEVGYTPRTVHLWRRHGRIPLRFLPLLELSPEEWDDLEIGRTRRHGGPINYIPARISIDYDLGFLVGFFIGDGSGTGNMIRLYVGMDESELVGKLLDTMARKFGAIGVVRKETHARMWVVQFNYGALKRAFRDVLRVGVSANKGKLVVPEWLLNGPEETRRGFLAGLIASDGCIHPQRYVIINSASRPFLEKVRLLLGTLAIPCHLYRHKNRGYTLFSLRFPAAYLKDVWLKDAHKARVNGSPSFSLNKKREGATFLPIRSIRRVPMRTSYAYCFEVDRSPNGFIVEGMVFSSNCFGYQGYKNARFGRIECHEAINAYARELLVRSMHLAEAHGYEVVHGIVDSLWLRPLPNHTPVEELVAAIRTHLGLPIDLEGTYKWIVFLPCKTTHIGALNRYYGLFQDGTMKLRGIEVRKHDTPPFVARAQEGMLAVFAQAHNAAEFVARIPRALEVLRQAARNLLAHRVPLEDLVITKVVTKPLAEYAVLNYTAAVLRQMRDRGFASEPGEYVRYVITDRRTRDYRRKAKHAAFLTEADEPDRWEYLRLLCRAGETLLAPFGYTEEGLLEWVTRSGELAAMV